MLEIDYIEVGARIRRRRKQLSLTQKKLAEMVNLSEGSVSRYESGLVKDATTVKLNEFAIALNVEVSWLLGVKTQDDAYHTYLEYYNKLKKLDDDTVEELLDIFDKIINLVLEVKKREQ